MSNVLTKNKTSTKEGYKKTKLGWIPEEWETKILGEFFEFKNGLNKEKEFFGYGTPIINYMDVNKKGSLMLDDINGKVSLSESEIQRFNIKKGDVFFTRTSETIDEIAYSTVLVEDVKDGVFSGFVLRARPRKLGELDINFTKYCFSTYIARKEIMSKSTFTTRALTNGRFLSEVNLLIPPLPEQHKIAKILSTWDKAIALQDRLIKQKQTLKKGLMQVLLTGKQRFPEFIDEWEEVRLGDVCEIKRGAGSQYITYVDESDSNSIRLIRITDFLSKDSKYILRTKDTERFLLEEGDLLIAGTGATAGITFEVPREFNGLVFSYNAPRIRVIKKVKKGFLIYYLKSDIILRQQLGLFTGNAQPFLDTKAIKRFKILIPKLEEQQKIASVLSNFDIEIKKLMTHKKSLIQQKQGLMQQLLSGEKRVKILKR
jgi:type I restriction enzyme S subunit